MPPANTHAQSLETKHPSPGDSPLLVPLPFLSLDPTPFFFPAPIHTSISLHSSPSVPMLTGRKDTQQREEGALWRPGLAHLQDHRILTARGWPPLSTPLEPHDAPHPALSDMTKRPFCYPDFSEFPGGEWMCVEGLGCSRQEIPSFHLMKPDQ